MVSINNPDFQEYHFLTSCYDEGISDVKVYTLFIYKVLIDICPPKSFSTNKFHENILNKYGVEVPPTLIKEILKDITKKTDKIKIKNDSITIISLPDFIIETSSQQKMRLENDTSIIRNEFNKQLILSGMPKSTDDEFRIAFNSYCNMIINRKYEQTLFSSIMSDWIYSIYRHKTNKDLVEAMDKMIYSWLLYTYYYSVKRQNKQLYGFKIALDTNMLAYLLNINGKERKMYVEYLLNKIKRNNCTIIVNGFTLNELKHLISNTDIPAIQIFRNENNVIVQQIIYNSEGFFFSLFENYGLRLIINKKTNVDVASKDFNDLSSNLKEYKTFYRPYISDHSLLHDIKLIYTFGGLHKIHNLYAEKKLIGTCDSVLCKWLSGYMKREYDSDYTSLISLETLSLIFWIETDKADTSSFLSGTWMYVTDSISYFNKTSVDEYFKKVRDKYNSSQIVPENWRSLYILLQEVIGRENIDDIDEDEFENAIDKINLTVFNENSKLRSEVTELQHEIRRLSDEIKNSRNTKIDNIIISSQKNIDEYSLFELIVAFLKKIFKWLIK